MSACIRMIKIRHLFPGALSARHTPSILEHTSSTRAPFVVMHGSQLDMNSFANSLFENKMKWKDMSGIIKHIKSHNMILICVHDEYMV